MTPRLICLVRRHQWHNGWDEERHVTVWTCKRCGKERREEVRRGDGTGGRYHHVPPGGAGGIDGGGFGGDGGG